MTTVPFTSDKWTYLLSTPVKPPSASDDGATFTLATNPKSDWYRTLESNANDGVVYGFKQEIPQDGFEISVDLSVDYKNQYDQAALFLYFSPTTWVKTGIEYTEDKPWSSVVVTNSYADWSLQPRTESSSTRFTISFKDSTLRIFLGDVMMREVFAFGVGEKGAFIGVMACSPKGGATDAVFTNFALRDGVRDH